MLPVEAVDLISMRRILRIHVLIEPVLLVINELELLIDSTCVFLILLVKCIEMISFPLGLMDL